MKPPFIVITVPHALCNSKTVNCDEISKKMSIKLVSKLSSKNSNLKVFLGDIPRYECDLNRYYCTKSEKRLARETVFRKKVKHFINRSTRKYRIFVLDVHSYSNSKDHKPGSKLRGHEFYVLTLTKNNFISNHFVQFMKNKGFKGDWFVENKQNDITLEFSNLENFLIEFNEDLSKKRNDQILDGIADWIDLYFFNPLFVSPVSGVIDYVGKHKIGVYIRIKDNHYIYSPVDGKPKLDTYQGEIIDDTDFRSFPNKRGKLIVTFVDGNKFEVLVGEGFVTDNIKIYSKKYLKMGERFAEIILGSYAYIWLNNNSFKKGLELHGGKSCLYLPPRTKIIPTYSKIKDIKFEVIKYPSKEFSSVQEDLSELEKICMPTKYDYPFEPFQERSRILLGYYLGEIVVFLVFTNTRLAWETIKNKGGIPNKEGYFVTSVCGDISRYRSLGIPLIDYYVNNIANKVEYSMLWVDPKNKGAIGLYEKYGKFELVNHIDGVNIMIRFERFKPLRHKVIKESKMSKSFKEDNLDSLDTFKDDLIVTAKSSNQLLVFDKRSLMLKKRIKRNLVRPNGIKIIKSFCFIVERDSHRVSVFKLPRFELIYRFGSEILKKPYGIDGVQLAIRIFDVYVTDINIVYKFRVNTLTDEVNFINKFGQPYLKKIESILILKKEILVADEERKKIAVFFKEKYIGDISRNYKYEPEGLAKFNEFIISVEQGPTPETNKFLIYEGLYKYKGYFITKHTKNTDGICIDKNYLYAVDDDKRISKIKL